MIKYPSIEQFRNTVKSVQLRHDFVGKDSNGDPIYEHTIPYPTISFNGTVKLHGTNAAIKLENSEISYQSRENIITCEKDNAGFANYMTSIQDKLLSLFNGFEGTTVIYGEWCGGNIQKGVAICELPKMFVIVSVLNNGTWVSNFTKDLPEFKIYNINNFLNYTVTVDFNNPDEAAEIMEKLTLDVENECPVGKAFGISGVGEGIVWESVNREYVFKTKGVKHQVTKSKVVGTEVEKQDLTEFITNTVTTNRLNQGLEQLSDKKSKKNTGVFTNWVVNDILKEESDTITTNGYNIDQVKQDISVVARKWYLNQCD
jgi:hypothetical protein